MFDRRGDEPERLVIKILFLWCYLREHLYVGHATSGEAAFKDTCCVNCTLELFLECLM